MMEDTSTFEGEFKRLLAEVERAHGIIMSYLSDRTHVNNASAQLRQADEAMANLREDLQALKSVWSRVP